ncbi:MAG: hypothetical protein BroJett025_05720 [Patescibacteria group bacterium]|nr:MAG: hypothetical protein BroJett025_05720 [Patescibacteria group bacterium]
MITQEQHEEWLHNPVGKIPKGEYCRTCGRFNSRTMAVNALLIKENSVLLVKRGEEPDKGFWDIPGGYIGWDETLEEGTARELLEETGLIVDPDHLEFFSVFSNPNNKAKNQVVDMYFVSRIFSGEMQVDGKEITESKWFDLNALPDNVAFDHMLALVKLQKALRE